DKALKLTVISISHIRETQTEALIVWSAQRINPLHVDVVANRHQAALAIVSVDPPDGVREDHGLDAHSCKYAYGESYFLDGIYFVQMNAPLHARYRHVSHIADHKPAAVPNGRRAANI